MYIYYNANPYGRRINDCTVRAISLATSQSWDDTYEELSNFARVQGTMFDDVAYIDSYLDIKFDKIYEELRNKITVKDFVKMNSYGTYLITMRDHITCCINGIIYDTFNPSDRLVWGIYKVEKKR